MKVKGTWWPEFSDELDFGLCFSGGYNTSSERHEPAVSGKRTNW
jgi:hypothetical protein